MENFQFVLNSGGLIPVLLMLPNVLWMLLPKPDPNKQVSEPLLLTIVENVGRIAIMILPFFYSLQLNRPFSVPVMIGIGLALAVYYAAWLRFFTQGRTPQLFRAPFLGIPLPLAVAPVVFLVLSSYLMDSWWMLGASVLFGVVHIWVSNLTL